MTSSLTMLWLKQARTVSKASTSQALLRSTAPTTMLLERTATWPPRELKYKAAILLRRATSSHSESPSSLSSTSNTPLGQIPSNNPGTALIAKTTRIMRSLCFATRLTIRTSSSHTSKRTRTLSSRTTTSKPWSSNACTLNQARGPPSGIFSHNVTTSETTISTKLTSRTWFRSSPKESDVTSIHWCTI